MFGFSNRNPEPYRQSDDDNDLYGDIESDVVPGGMSPEEAREYAQRKKDDSKIPSLDCFGLFGAGINDGSDMGDYSGIEEREPLNKKKSWAKSIRNSFGLDLDKPEADGGENGDLYGAMPGDDASFDGKVAASNPVSPRRNTWSNGFGLFGEDYSGYDRESDILGGMFPEEARPHTNKRQKGKGPKPYIDVDKMFLSLKLFDTDASKPTLHDSFFSMHDDDDDDERMNMTRSKERHFGP